MSYIWELSVEEWINLCRSGSEVSVKVILSGNSMRSLIRKDLDSITIIPLHRPLQQGDIVLFLRFDGAYTVHRVYRLSKKYLQTLGDGCLDPDAPVPYENVLGLVAAVECNGHRYDLDSFWHRLLGRTWMSALPLRRTLIKVSRKMIKHGKTISRSPKSS